MPGAWTTGERGHFLRTAFSRNNSLPLSPPATPLALPWPQPLLMFNPQTGQQAGVTTREVSPGGVVPEGGTPPGTSGGTCVPAAVSGHLRKPPG